MDSAREGATEGARRRRYSLSGFDEMEGERCWVLRAALTIIGWKKDMVIELRFARGVQRHVEVICPVGEASNAHI
jgi:hypothetical protein